MENRERYKRLIMFLASAVIIAIETLLFAYIWYKFYAHKEVIDDENIAPNLYD